MNILALDTSMGVCSVAIVRADGSVTDRFVREAEMARRHAEALMPMLEDVLDVAGLKAADLDIIAATQGPGSFTGVRIAIAAARGLALVCGARLFGTDSLTVMARAARREGFAPNAPFAVAVDARRGMVYLAVFDQTGRRLSGPDLYTQEEAVEKLPAELDLVIGNGAALLAVAAKCTRKSASHHRELTTDLPTLQPGALALAELTFAEPTFAELGLTERSGLEPALSSSTPSDRLRPLYLRPPDAKPQKSALERR